MAVGMGFYQFDASERLFEAMTCKTAKMDWAVDVYGPGAGPRAIEVHLTRASLKKNGISEISSSEQIPCFNRKAELDAAFLRLHDLCNRKPRVDGYVLEPQYFWESKVSKIDITRGLRGGRCLYDIGQWAYDLIKLQEIGKAIPEVGLVYSIVGISKNRFAAEFNEKNLATVLLDKARSEFRADLKRDTPELSEVSKFRNRQRKVLSRFLKLDPDAFAVRASKKWAVFSLDVRQLENI